MTDPTPTPTPTTSTGTASRWGTAGTPSGVAPGTVPIPTQGSIKVSGFGDAGSVGRGANRIPTYFDYIGYSSSDLNGILESMILKKDPRVTQLMQQLGVNDLASLRKAWKKAASVASSIAKTGQEVDFFQVLGSPSTYDLTGTGDGAQTTQQYTTNYFTAKGKPNAAANVLLRETLAKVLGHVPSEEEIGQYRPLLDEMQKQQKAGLFTTSVNNKTGVTTPGIDPKQWLAEQISNKHQARVQYGKETAPVSTQNSYVRLAQDYGYNPYNPDGTLSESARLVLSKIESGKMSLEDAQEQLKQAALAKYAYLKPQFDAGLTLRQIADPAISAVSNILEKDPNTITVNDPSIQKYLYGIDGKGAMPMYKYEAMLRQDPSWQFTNNARSQFADLAAFIGQKFGMNT